MAFLPCGVRLYCWPRPNSRRRSHAEGLSHSPNIKDVPVLVKESFRMILHYCNHFDVWRWAEAVAVMARFVVVLEILAAFNGLTGLQIIISTCIEYVPKPARHGTLHDVKNNLHPQLSASESRSQLVKVYSAEYSAEHTHSHNVDLILYHRLQCWPNIETTLCSYLHVCWGSDYEDWRLFFA